MPKLDSCRVRAKGEDFSLHKSLGPHSGGRHTFVLEKQILFGYVFFLVNLILKKVVSARKTWLRSTKTTGIRARGWE